MATAAAVIGRVMSTRPHVSGAARRIIAEVKGGPRAVTAVLGELDRAGVITEDFALRRPTLDDVSLRLTGHNASAPSDQEGRAA